MKILIRERLPVTGEIFPRRRRTEYFQAEVSVWKRRSPFGRGNPRLRIPMPYRTASRLPIVMIVTVSNLVRKVITADELIAEPRKPMRPVVDRGLWVSSAWLECPRGVDRRRAGPAGLRRGRGGDCAARGCVAAPNQGEDRVGCCDARGTAVPAAARRPRPSRCHRRRPRTPYPDRPAPDPKVELDVA